MRSGKSVTRHTQLKLPPGLSPAKGKIGVSVSAYARYRGCQPSAIYMALQIGRISRLPDGSLDPIQCDLDWRKNASTPGRPIKAIARRKAAKRLINKQVEENLDKAAGTEDDDDLSVGDGIDDKTWVGARIRNTKVKTAQAELDLKRSLGEVIDRDRVKKRIFQQARTFRDALVNWPARVSAEIAAELNANPRQVLSVLEREMRRLLEEVAGVSLEIKGDD